MNREELIKALRCCTSGPSVADCKDKCAFYKGADMSLCIPEMGSAAADMLENDQRHIEAVMVKEFTAKLEELAQVKQELHEVKSDLTGENASRDAILSDFFKADRR